MTSGGAFRITSLGALLLVLVAVTALYWPGLKGELIVDDLPNLKPLGDLATGAIGWQDVVFNNDSGPLGRPLSMVSLIADFVFGDGAVFQYKRTNLIIHLLCGTLLYILSFELFTRAGRVAAGPGRWWALLVASLWLTAPLFASTVLYVIQRMAQLSTLFSLAGMVLYVSGRLDLDDHGRRGTILVLAAYCIAWPAAVLSKENGALLPLLLLVLEAFWFGFGGRPQTRRILTFVHCGFFAVPATTGVVWGLTHVNRIVGGYVGREFSLTERVLTETRALWDYVRQLLVPDGARMGVVQDDYPISHGLFDPPTTILSLVSWLILGVLLWACRKHAAARAIAFGMVFFLCGHLVESTIFPLEMYFEHRNYLPSTGLLIGAVYAVAISMDRLPRLTRLAPLLALLPVIYGFVTFQRVLVWQSAEAIARMAEHTHARSPRLQTALISLYTRENDLDRAKAHLRKLAELEGGTTAGHALQAISTYCHLRHTPTASEYAEVRSTRRLVDNVYTRNQVADLADLLQTNGCTTFDFNEIRDWLVDLAAQAKSTGNWVLLFHSARIFESLGNPTLAIDLLDTATLVDPSRLEPRLVKLRILIAQGESDDARKVLASLDDGSLRPVKYQTELIQHYKEVLAR